MGRMKERKRKKWGGLGPLTGGVPYMEGVGCGPDGYRKEGGGGKLQLQLE
jgi:hypothetical protein